MARRVLLILAEFFLIVATIGIIVATWLPIDGFRTWLTRVL